MTRNIHLVDSKIHDTVLESLKTAGVTVSDSPKGASALVTQDQNMDDRLLREAGDTLRAIVKGEQHA
jgi:hypothetical protein